MSTNESSPTLEEQIDQFAPTDENNLSITLNNQKVTDQNMDTIVKHAIQKRQCISLDLHDNKITWEGTSILSAALTNNTTLKTLHLHHNPLSDKGIYVLAQILTSKNDTLEVLGLNEIDLTDVGGEDLAAMLQKNHTLTHLHLKGNKIGDRGIQYLADALTNYNTTLTHLELAENKFESDSSVDYLADMIKRNRSLKVLDVRLCNISDSGKTKLQEAIESNKNLQVLL